MSDRIRHAQEQQVFFVGEQFPPIGYGAPYVEIASDVDCMGPDLVGKLHTLPDLKRARALAKELAKNGTMALREGKRLEVIESL